MNILNEIHDVMSCFDPPRSVLFIGGVADGMRSPDPETPSHVLMAPSVNVEYELTHVPSEFSVERSLYRREHICAGRDKIVIYVFSELTMSQSIGKLIHGYSVTF